MVSKNYWLFLLFNFFEQMIENMETSVEKQMDTSDIISDRLMSLSDSQTFVMAQKSRDMRAKGIDVITLSIGEPDFDTPEHIKDAARKAIAEKEYTAYPPVSGYADLKQAISEKFKKDNNLDYSPEQIVVSNGAKHSIANTVLSIINHGDEVIVPVPFWVSYREIVKLAGGKNVIIKATLENDFKITPEQLENAITHRTKLFFFNSPSNPTGSVYTREEIKALAEVLAKHPRIFVISDEIYEHINFIGKHESFAQFPEIKDRVITVNGVSKAYAMTGWRVGYIGAPAVIAKAITKIQGQMTSGVCGIAQRAALAALTSPKSMPSIEKMRDKFKSRRDLVLDLMAEIPGLKNNTPKGAFYVFPDISSFFGKAYGKYKIEDANSLCDYLLEEGHVALVSGTAFGSPDNFRFSYAASEAELEEALKRIKATLSKLS